MCQGVNVEGLEAYLITAPYRQINSYGHTDHVVAPSAIKHVVTLTI